MMHFGSQRYSAPLRRDLISPTEHSTLFQNSEEIVAVSEYQLQKLECEIMRYFEGISCHQSLAEMIGSIYAPKSSRISDVLERYSNGVQSSLRLLAELKEYQEFEMFLKVKSPFN